MLVNYSNAGQAVQLTLAGLQDEGNTVPALVLNIGDQGAEGWAARLLRHGVVLQVTRLASIQ